jgi:hypothetical protein
MKRGLMMQRLWLLVFLLAINIIGCASKTWIYSIPEKVKVVSPEGRLLGLTPYFYWDRSISGNETTFVLKNDGYKDKEIIIKKDQIYISRFFFPPILALPWLMGYEGQYYFELERN